MLFGFSAKSTFAEFEMAFWPEMAFWLKSPNYNLQNFSQTKSLHTGAF